MLNQLASASKSYLFMVALVTWTVSNGVKVGLNSVTATRVNTWAQHFIGKCVTFESSDWLMTVAGTSQYWPNFCLIYFQLSEQARLGCCSNTTAVQSSPNLNNSMIHYQSKLLWSEIPVPQNAIVLQKWWLKLLNQGKFLWDHSLDCRIRAHWARARWCRAAGSCNRSWGWTPAPFAASWPDGPGSGIWNWDQGQSWLDGTLSTSTWSGCRGSCRDMKGHIRCMSCQTQCEETGGRSSQHWRTGSVARYNL